jgi:hypothetical protein
MHFSGSRTGLASVTRGIDFPAYGPIRLWSQESLRISATTRRAIALISLARGSEAASV